MSITQTHHRLGHSMHPHYAVCMDIDAVIPELEGLENFVKVVGLYTGYNDWIDRAPVFRYGALTREVNQGWEDVASLFVRRLSPIVDEVRRRGLTPVLICGNDYRLNNKQSVARQLRLEIIPQQEWLDGARIPECPGAGRNPS